MTKRAVVKQSTIAPCRDAAEIARDEAHFAGDARAAEQEAAKAKSARTKLERLRDDLTRHIIKMKNRAARKGARE